MILDQKVSICQTWKGTQLTSYRRSTDILTNCLLLCYVAMTGLPKSKVRSIGVSNFTIEHVSFTDHFTVLIFTCS